MEHREIEQRSNKWIKRQGEKGQENRSLVDKSFSIDSKKYLTDILFLIIIFIFSVRGFIGFVQDIKPSEKTEIIVSPIISEKEPEKKAIERPSSNSVDKNQTLKDRIFKEKGIILTDEDIRRYGNSK